MTLSRFRLLLFIALLSACGFTTVLFTPAVSYAKSSEKSLKKKLNKATSLYDEIEIEAAEDVLTDAISEAASSNMSGLTVAKLHIMLGIVRFATNGEESEAEEQFIEAVRADPAIDIPGVYRTPILEKILKRAQAKVPKKLGDNTGEPNVGSFQHDVISIANAGEDLKISVNVPTQMPVFKMFFHLRRFEESAFKKFELTPKNATTFSVDIPGDEIYTSQLDYFITAEDRGGKVIARAGDDTAPNNVVVMGSGNTKKADEKDPKEKNPKDASEKVVFIDLSFGTGIGFLTGGENNSPTANPTRDVKAGIVAAFGHANVGFGAVINKQMQLGLEFRIQFAPTQNFDGLENSSSLDPGSGFWDTKVPCFGLGAPVDCMMRLKYKYLFGDSIFYSSVGTGVGRVRNWLQLRSSANQSICTGRAIETDVNGNDFCFIRDTVRTGWFHFGLGGGLMFPVVDDTLSLYADTFLMILVPDTSVNLDIQAGLQVRF